MYIIILGYLRIYAHIISILRTTQFDYFSYLLMNISRLLRNTEDQLCFVRMLRVCLDTSDHHQKPPTNNGSSNSKCPDANFNPANRNPLPHRNTLNLVTTLTLIIMAPPYGRPYSNAAIRPSVGPSVAFLIHSPSLDGGMRALPLQTYSIGGSTVGHARIQSWGRHIASPRDTLFTVY